MDITIDLPKPHDKQKEIMAHPAPRKVICAGRRGGKTALAASLKTIPHFLNRGRVLYGAPVSAQTDVFWETITEHLYPLIKAGFLYRNKTERYVEWLTGRDGRIKAKTAYDADTWRGDWGDLLIYDEYAFMSPDAWQVVGAPMLLDNDGEAWFISTPNRKNHFHSLFVNGLDPHNERWQSFRFSSYDNPHLSKTALEEIKSDMTADMIRQEIMAEFLDNEGAVFRNIAACMNAPETEPGDHKNHHIIAGVDWGKHKDYTVISVGCRDCAREIYLDRFNKIDYSFQRSRLATAVSQWGVIDILAESNAMGEPNIEQLQLEGLPVRPFQTTAQSKPPLIENLALGLERAEWQFLNIPIATAEMEAYEMKVSPTTGRVSYSAPAGVHDDTVIARALMLQAVNSYMPAFL